jgi:plasmid stabilization system protein ParE
MIVRIHPLADVDLEEIFLYYEANSPGRGFEFLDEYNSGIHKIIQNPNAWQRLDETYRRYRLSKFPYGIIYLKTENNELMVTSILHLTRRPGLWRSRKI